MKNKGAMANEKKGNKKGSLRNYLLYITSKRVQILWPDG
jgi:hypothetical protein